MTTLGTINTIAPGVRIHRWIVLGPAEPSVTRSGRSRGRWHCQCDCGQKKSVLEQNLKLALRRSVGGSRSCGCFTIERATVHGHNRGRNPSAEYCAWQAAKKRCGNPRNASYKNYGGRGIAMCRRWSESFEAFLADLGPKPQADWSLDRIAFDRGYEPGNCRWAPPVVQSRNRRSTRLYVFEGQISTIGEVARFLGITRDQARALERNGRLPARRTESVPRNAHELAANIILDLNSVTPAAHFPLEEGHDRA